MRSGVLTIVGGTSVTAIVGLLIEKVVISGVTRSNGLIDTKDDRPDLNLTVNPSVEAKPVGRLGGYSKSEEKEVDL